MSSEVWKTVDGFPMYSISSLGRLRRDVAGRGAKVGRIMRTPNDGRGYPTATIPNAEGVKRTVHIHRLVASAFIPNPEEKYSVNHIDGDKTNNVADNLEWADRAEQIEHAIRTGLFNTKGERHHRALLNERQVAEILTYPKSVKSPKIAEIFGVSASCIKSVRNGYNWKHVARNA